MVNMEPAETMPTYQETKQITVYVMFQVANMDPAETIATYQETIKITVHVMS